MASYCKLLAINLRISPDIEDHVIKYIPNSMVLKSEISPKTFEILKKVKFRTGFFGVADPLIPGAVDSPSCRQPQLKLVWHTHPILYKVKISLNANPNSFLVQKFRANQLMLANDVITHSSKQRVEK